MMKQLLHLGAPFLGTGLKRLKISRIRIISFGNWNTKEWLFLYNSDMTSDVMNVWV